MVNWAAFNRARSFLAAERWRTLGAGACAVLSSLCFVALVIIVGCLAQLLFTPEYRLQSLVRRADGQWLGPIALMYARFPFLERSFCLALLLVGTIILAGLRAACRYLQSRLVARAVVEATHRLRRAIYRQAYRLGTTEVSGIGAAPAINVFTRDTNAVRDGLFAWLDAFIREPVKLVLLVALALMASWSLALLFLLLVALGAFLAQRMIERAKARAAAATRSAAERLALLQESLFMLRLTRGYLMESYEHDRFERNLDEFARSEAYQLRSAAAIGPLIGLVAILGVTLVTGLASYNLLYDELAASSTAVLYASLIGISWPAATLLRRYETIRQGAEAATAIFVFLDQRAQFGQVADASFLPPMSKGLEFVQIRLQEPQQPPVLDGVSLIMRAGTRTAIMGLDDRAKRALVYLIPRFLDPSEGRVEIDGQDIRLVTLESLRAQVALVLQGELVFTDTVAGNIGCGDPSFGLPHIVDAAKISHAHQFIQRLPKGYDTVIGDQGEILSASQQFRIALARAILRDPTIVVIEEPRYHLDDDTKNLLDDTLARFCPGRTVIFLPHRLSTIRSCDSIVILHGGKIETIGTHRELTLNSELYRHLQYTEFNVFAAS